MDDIGLEYIHHLELTTRNAKHGVFFNACLGAFLRFSFRGHLSFRRWFLQGGPPQLQLGFIIPVTRVIRTLSHL